MDTPRPAPPPAPDDADLAAATPPRSLRLCSGIVMVAGLTGALTGLQNLLGFQMFGLYFAMPAALLALGLVTLAVGWPLGKGRTWAGVLALFVALALGAASTAWLLLSLASGGLSLLAFVSVATSALATIAAGASIGPCRRVTAAQERLRAAGMDLGL